MPKTRKNEQVRCTYFVWRLVNRGGMWYADGRSNTPSAGRHSLGTKDKQEARRSLPELDRVRAEDIGLIPRSPGTNARGRPLPLCEGRKLYEQHTRKAESERAYCYRSGEVKAMVELCRANPSLAWLGDVIVALACTGLRIAELASLRWSDLDLNAKQLKLTDETGRPVNSIHKRRELKSGRSRTFPIHFDLLVVLKRRPRHDGYVFHGPRGGRLKPDTVRRILVREVITPLAERFPTPDGEKGFADGRLHSFRHYFCSTCANNGVPERMVMDWLGHADSEMIRYYYHLHDEEAQRRMNGLDFLGGAGGRSTGQPGGNFEEEDVEPPPTEGGDAGDRRD